MGAYRPDGSRCWSAVPAGYLPVAAGEDGAGICRSGALIYVGVLMTSSLARVNWQDLTECVPAFITAVMMPFSFSITEGIALGFISYCVMKIGTGRLRDLSPCVIIVALLFILKIVFIDAH